MPYSSVSEVPKYVKKYSPKTARQWMHVFNSTYTKTSSEARAMKAANSILKKRMSKETYSNDYINHLVDKWLGNLEG